MMIPVNKIKNKLAKRFTVLQTAFSHTINHKEKLFNSVNEDVVGFQDYTNEFSHTIKFKE